MNTVIIDYGMGNVVSIKNLLKRLSFNSIITSNIEDIKKADKIILPGVGHFETGMKNILQRNLFDTLTYKILKEKTPILGICLGMQLFFESSEESDVSGLGWLKGKSIKFQIEDSKYKVPHIGWNNLDIILEDNLLKGINKQNYFYFAHSYCLSSIDQKYILSYTHYDMKFVSIIKKDNIYGTQFHPEKSHDSGIAVLKNFMDIQIV